MNNYPFHVIKVTRKLWHFICAILLLNCQSGLAQVTSDDTLPKSTTVLKHGNTFLIKGGTERKRNLFHSFNSLSLGEGQVLEFQSQPNIQNIITRISGRSPSKFNGIIKSINDANIIILNPSGLNFLPAFKLDIQGNFLATTANLIGFEDKLIYSADNSDLFLPLSSNNFVSLTFLDSNSIKVKNTGHELSSGLLTPALPNGTPKQFSSKPGKSISLIGNGIIFDGGIVNAPGGRILIGSVERGEIGFHEANNSFIFDYSDTSTFGDIFFSNRSLLDTSGFGESFIQIDGQSVSILEGSEILSQNQGLVDHIGIKVTAQDSLFISGTDPFARINGGIGSETLTSANSGDIQINASDVSVVEGGTINTRTFGAGDSGKIQIYSDQLNVIGFSPINAENISTLTTLSSLGSSGKSGDINIFSNNVHLADGGILNSITFGLVSSQSGNVNIEAKKDILIDGIEPSLLSPSTIGSTTFLLGKAGDVRLKTKNLFVLNSGRVDSTTLAFGDSGGITIDANGLVRVSGQYPGSINPSSIIASANVVDEPLRQAFNLPELPIGDSGNVEIKSPSVIVEDGAAITVRNDGFGRAGTLKLMAEQTSLNKGSLTSSAFSGNGGILDLRTSSINLSNSVISASAGGDGVGGQISINSILLTADAQSRITARAENAQGGTIDIRSNGLLVSPETEISASSQLGPQFDGSINVSTQSTQLGENIATLSTLSPQEIYQVCQGALPSYTPTGSGDRPSPLLDPIQAGRSLQARQAAVENVQYVDAETGEVRPFRRWLGIQETGDNAVEFVYDPNQNKNLKDLISYAERKCKISETP
jgi:filamentous hemagglutinin family protein